MSRTRLALACLVVTGSVVAGVASPLLARASGGDTLATASSTAGAVMLAVVGALVLVRRPENKLGIIFSLAGVLWAVGDASNHYANLAYRLHADPGDAGVIVAAWVSEWFWIPWLFLTFVFSLLLFPTGHLPSDRWRPLAWVAGTTVVVVTLAAMLESELTPAFSDLVVRNPVGIPGHADVEEGWFSIWFVVLPISMVGALVSLVARYRRARGEERQQIKLVTFAAILLVGGFVSGLLGDLIFAAKLPVVESLLNLLLPVAAGIAILKHGLFEIDVVISRTVVFAGLVAFITAIYVGIVVGVGTLLGTGDEPNLALSIVATAVVAVAFQPVRERLTRVANRLVFGHRVTPYEVLSTFAAHVAGATTPELTLERMAKLVSDGTGVDRAIVWLKADGVARAAAVWPEALLLEPIADRPWDDGTPFEDFDHVEEVRHDGELLGAITLGEARGEALNHTEQELLSDLAGQAALVLRNLRLTEELRARIADLHASRRRLVRAQDDERRRLERDLHDGSQQQLAHLTRAAQGANESAEREGATQVASLLAQIVDEGEEAIRTVRELAHGIYPPLLAAEGLPGALASRAAKAAVPMTVEANGLGRYDRDVEAAVYFCVLEAVNNAAKYADASEVTVRLSQSNGHLEFEIIDDGIGFDPGTVTRGHGTTNMADRLDALGGRLHITSRPGDGTSIRGKVLAVSRHQEAHA